MRQSVGGGAKDASVRGRGCEGCVSPGEGVRRMRQSVGGEEAGAATRARRGVASEGKANR